MGIFDKLFPQRGSPRAADQTSTGQFDPFLGDVELHTAHRALVEGDWAWLEQFLARSEHRWLFSSIITGNRVGVSLETFNHWLESTQSPQARVHLAAARLQRADHVHNAFEHKWANGVRPVGPHEGDADWLDNELLMVESELYEIVADRPAMADPWVYLLVTGRMLGIDPSELQQRFDGAHSRHPFRPDACRQYLAGLASSDSSTDEMFVFARWLEDAAPGNSASRLALPTTHIEHGRRLEGKGALAHYLLRPDVTSELTSALADICFNTPLPAPVESLGVLNAYAFALSADSPDTAGLIIETYKRLDNRPTEFPWALHSHDVGEAFVKVRNQQLKLADAY